MIVRSSGGRHASTTEGAVPLTDNDQRRDAHHDDAAAAPELARVTAAEPNSLDAPLESNAPPQTVRRALAAVPTLTSRLANKYPSIEHVSGSAALDAPNAMSERGVAGLRTRFWDYAPANQLLDAATPPTPASLAPEQVAVGERAQDRQRRLFGAAIRANPALDPRAPAESPVVLAMLAWARSRQITKSFLDQMPIPNFEQSTENEPVPNTETPPVEEAGAVPSTRLFTGDYDTGDFSDWRWMHNAYYDGTGTDNPQTSYAARVVDDPERGKVARYELRSGDIAVGDNERTEVVGPIVGREGETGWYALSYKFDPEFPMDHASQGWGVVSQFHTETDGSPR